MKERNPEFEKKSWKEQFKNDVSIKLQISSNFDEFKGKMEESGYIFKMANKNITISDKENHKARLKTLNSEWDNEYILNYSNEVNKALILPVMNFSEKDREKVIEIEKIKNRGKNESENRNTILIIELEKLNYVEKENREMIWSNETEDKVYENLEKIREKKEKIFNELDFSEYQKSLIKNNFSLAGEKRNLENEKEQLEKQLNSTEWKDKLLDNFTKGKYSELKKETKEFNSYLNKEKSRLDNINPKFYQLKERKQKDEDIEKYNHKISEIREKRKNLEKMEKLKDTEKFGNFKLKEDNKIIEEIKKIIEKLKELEVVKFLMDKVKQHKDYISFQKEKEVKKSKKVDFRHKTKSKDKDLER